MCRSSAKAGPGYHHRSPSPSPPLQYAAFNKLLRLVLSLGRSRRIIGHHNTTSKGEEEGREQHEYAKPRRCLAMQPTSQRR